MAYHADIFVELGLARSDGSHTAGQTNTLWLAMHIHACHEYILMDRGRLNAMMKVDDSKGHVPTAAVWSQREKIKDIFRAEHLCDETRDPPE